MDAANVYRLPMRAGRVLDNHFINDEIEVIIFSAINFENFRYNATRPRVHRKRINFPIEIKNWVFTYRISGYLESISH